jgi:hypothetical protein
VIWVVVVVFYMYDKVLGRAPVKGRLYRNFVKLDKSLILNEKPLALLMCMHNVFLNWINPLF